MLNLCNMINKGSTYQTNLYFNVPNRLRIAPLYLISGYLNNNISTLVFDDVSFQSFDFDA